jgi:hypothetical protein
VPEDVKEPFYRDVEVKKTKKQKEIAKEREKK